MDAKAILLLTNLALLIPLGYLYTRLREVDRMVQATNTALRRDYYPKEETDKMIDLKLVPVSVSLKNIQDDISEIKELIKESAARK